LVAYSGQDDFSAVGPALRPYARLEPLYVDMFERVGGRRKVRLPANGYVSERIDRLVRETEEEETEDDEEGEEVLHERLRVRERRRVVECEVRLGE
jgi:hypothetical protein